LQLQELYEKNGLTLTRSSIGVITPYRAQIAQIQQVLQEKKLPISLITVDTVERYQGGARDIIILSLCTNHASQVKSLVSLSDDGIDRKLNVALTRAKQQIIVLGNSTLLQEVGSYKELMEWLEE
jgi:DNA replication ATP-dependent helicase Dna2